MSRRALLTEAGIAAVVVGVLAALAWLTVPEACADTGAVVDEAEREGVDLLYAALAALVTAVGGWLVKRPQDYIAERRAAQNGSQGVSGAIPGEAKAHEVEGELKEHLRDCKEYRREMRDELRRLYERLDGVAGDVRYIKGRMDGPQQGGVQA